MQITQKSRETIDACRFCWMCRHICPIGNATGQERNTARARALGLSMVLRDVECIKDFADNLYECALCGACTKECLTGWDPTAFTAEVKLEAALAGAMPTYIQKLLENVETTGNVFGASELSSELQAEIESLPKTADILLFLGKSARVRNPQGACNAIQVLKKAGVPFTVLTDEPTSGADLFFLAGAAEETRQAMAQTAKTLHSFKTIIVYDPADAKMFLRFFREWNLPLDSEIRTFTAALAQLISVGKLRVKNSGQKFTFQDPPALARDLEETVPAREILNACGSNLEMLMHAKDTNLAGHLIMAEYLPDTIRLVAARRWREAAGVGAEIVVTASPDEYVALKSTQPENIQLLSLEEVILQCL